MHQVFPPVFRPRFEPYTRAARDPVMVRRDPRPTALAAFPTGEPAAAASAPLAPASPRSSIPPRLSHLPLHVKNIFVSCRLSTGLWQLGHVAPAPPSPDLSSSSQHE